jgi:indolepyruvate ferredoxin oxidoreductase alpha subunit
LAKSFISLDKPGMRGLAIGNAAIARGCLEAGVKMGSGYPGTPSTEILENFAMIAVENPELKINVEWSINEKVGFEVAIGGSMCNARSIATMKHVGLNVASEPFMNMCYAGVKGGLVVISADDPSLHSSQNEQDNRFFGMQALAPVFEPATVQEAKDMMKFAFEFSEKYNTVVVFRTTTRLNHARGDLTLGEIQKIDRTYQFDPEKDQRWVFTPENARKHRKDLIAREKTITIAAESFPFNEIKKNPKAKVGIISSGVPYAQVLDALELLGLQDQVSLFKLGLVNPLPKSKLTQFMQSVEKIVIIEELEPVIEQQVKQLAFEEKIKKPIIGKSVFPQIFELFPEIIIEKLANIFDIPNPLKIPNLQDMVASPARPPVLCAGCGHRNIYTAVKRTERRLRVRFIHSSDIGCYTLGFYEPLNGIDTCIAMGGSIGLANGFSHLDQRVSYAFLGDSTFFHSGIPGLVNAIANHNNIIIVIMDNGSTCMTGHQDHPGTGVKIDKTPGQKIKIANLVEGLGVPRTHIWVPDSDNLTELETAFEEAITAQGVRVVIPTSMCSLLKVNESKKTKIPIIKYTIDQDICTSKEYCIRSLGCPAISKIGDEIIIDDTQCAGCSMCSQVCPRYAIKPKNTSKTESD